MTKQWMIELLGAVMEIAFSALNKVGTFLALCFVTFFFCGAVMSCMQWVGLWGK